MPNGQPRRSLDASRARELFGFAAGTPLREGLERTIAWHREHADSRTPAAQAWSSETTGAAPPRVVETVGAFPRTREVIGSVRVAYALEVPSWPCSPSSTWLALLRGRGSALALLRFCSHTGIFHPRMSAMAGRSCCCRSRWFAGPNLAGRAPGHRDSSQHLHSAAHSPLVCDSPSRARSRDDSSGNFRGAALDRGPLLASSS